MQNKPITIRLRSKIIKSHFIIKKKEFSECNTNTDFIYSLLKSHSILLEENKQLKSKIKDFEFLQTLKSLK